MHAPFMNRLKNKPLLTILLLSAAGLWFLWQPAEYQPAHAQQSPQPVNNAPPILYMERTNWSVFDPYNRGLDLSQANTYEARYARWKGVLAIEFPAEHAKQFPPTAEQQQAMRDSAVTIEHPQTLQEYMNEPRPPEEQATLEQSLDSILHPKPAAQ